MSASPIALFICEKVLRDMMSPHKLSFIGVFSGFLARSLPFVCPPMFLAAQYGGGQGEFEHRFEIEHSSGQKVFKSPPRKFFLDNRTAAHTDIVGTEGVIFNHPGQYWIISILDGEERSRAPLTITYKPLDFTPSTGEGGPQ